MGRGGPKMINDFLLGHLNGESFGEQLKWVNIKNGEFEIQWEHKSGSKWNPSFAAPFQAWDILKGRQVGGKNYFMKAKGRFRSALNKLVSTGVLDEVPTLEKWKKRYKINFDKIKKKDQVSEANEAFSPKSESSHENYVDLNGNLLDEIGPFIEDGGQSICYIPVYPNTQEQVNQIDGRKFKSVEDARHYLTNDMQDYLTNDMRDYSTNDVQVYTNSQCPDEKKIELTLHVTITQSLDKNPASHDICIDRIGSMENNILVGEQLYLANECSPPLPSVESMYTELTCPCPVENKEMAGGECTLPASEESFNNNVLKDIDEWLASGGDILR